jgi:DnaJ-class molecular chaperone
MYSGEYAMGIVIIIALIFAVGWWVDLRIHPFRRCPRCNGRRRNPGSSSTHWGYCSRCHGRGEVRRYGAPED